MGSKDLGKKTGKGYAGPKRTREIQPPNEAAINSVEAVRDTSESYNSAFNNNQQQGNRSSASRTVSQNDGYSTTAQLGSPPTNNPQSQDYLQVNQNAYNSQVLYGIQTGQNAYEQFAYQPSAFGSQYTSHQHNLGWQASYHDNNSSPWAPSKAFVQPTSNVMAPFDQVCKHGCRFNTCDVPGCVHLRR